MPGAKSCRGTVIRSMRRSAREVSFAARPEGPLNREVTMIQLRRADERGRTQNGWLDSRHTFSFGEYYDKRFQGYRGLRVINDDRVEAGRGFGSHAHHDLEILTWVLSGQLAHRDSLGNGAVIHPNDLQRMTAGRGIIHCEMNPSFSHPVHFLQIWIEPEAKGLSPAYEQRHFDPAERRDRWQLLAMRIDPRSERPKGVVGIHADVSLFANHLPQGQTIEVPVPGPKRGQWLHVVSGMVDLGGTWLREGDAAAIEGDHGRLELRAETASELLLFDLA